MLHLKRVQLPRDCHGTRPSQNKFPLGVFAKKGLGYSAGCTCPFSNSLEKDL